MSGPHNESGDAQDIESDGKAPVVSVIPRNGDKRQIIFVLAAVCDDPFCTVVMFP
jgi:hypothetical protein